MRETRGVLRRGPRVRRVAGVFGGRAFEGDQHIGRREPGLRRLRARIGDDVVPFEATLDVGVQRLVVAEVLREIRHFVEKDAVHAVLCVVAVDLGLHQRFAARAIAGVHISDQATAGRLKGVRHRCVVTVEGCAGAAVRVQDGGDGHVRRGVGQRLPVGDAVIHRIEVGRYQQFECADGVAAEHEDGAGDECVHDDSGSGDARIIRSLCIRVDHSGCGPCARKASKASAVSGRANR